MATIYRTLTYVTASVNPSASTQRNDSIPSDVLDIIKIKVVPSNVGPLELTKVEIFNSSSFATGALVYATNSFTGSLIDPVWNDGVTPTEKNEGFICKYQDLDLVQQLHLKITNNGTLAKTYTVTITYIASQDLRGGIIDVKRDFGATGDGTTDDTAAIAAAITFAATNGQVVYFPTGTYKHSGIAMPDANGIELNGDGPTLSILNYTGSGTAIYKTSTATNNSFYRFSNFKLVDVGTGTKGLDMTSMWFSRATNLWVSGFTTDIYMQQGPVGTYWNVVDQCYMDTCTRGYWISATGTTGLAANNRIIFSTVHSFTTAGIQVDNGTETNAALFNNLETTSAARFIDWQSDRGTIQGNYCETATAANTGLYLRGSSNTAIGNVYVTFTTQIDYSTLFANDLYESHAKVFVVRHDATFGIDPGGVGIGIEASYPLHVYGLVGGVSGFFDPGGDANNTIIVKAGNSGTGRNAAIDFYQNATRSWSLVKDSTGDLNIVNVVGGGGATQAKFKSSDGSTLFDLGGVILGGATGGQKGVGSLNAAADIYKNNAAYTNPDYAFEHYFTGKIDKFKNNEGAAQYKGLQSISKTKAYAKRYHRLPNVHAGKGVFHRSDILLEKLEEAYLYIFELDQRLHKLENSKVRKNGK